MKKFTIDVRRTGQDDKQCSKYCPQLHKEPLEVKPTDVVYRCALDNSVLRPVALDGYQLPHLFCTATCDRLCGIDDI